MLPPVHGGGEDLRDPLVVERASIVVVADGRLGVDYPAVLVLEAGDGERALAWVEDRT